MDTEKIVSNFKIVSKPVDFAPTVFSKSMLYNSLRQILYLCIFILIWLILYYRKEDVYSWFRRLWVYTHLNKNGELASIYVPDEYDIRRWGRSAPG